MYRFLLRKIYLIILFLFFLLTLWSYKLKSNNAINYKIKNKTYNLLVADSIDEWTKGLMNIKKLNKTDGMIFLFPDKKPRVFWNKNTHLDLDVYWIFDNKVVGRDFLPSIDKSNGVVYVSSQVPVNKVAEIIHK